MSSWMKQLDEMNVASVDQQLPTTEAPVPIIIVTFVLLPRRIHLGMTSMMSSAHEYTYSMTAAAIGVVVAAT